jgi:hypothetical protein
MFFFFRKPQVIVFFLLLNAEKPWCIQNAKVISVFGIVVVFIIMI